ncbi:DUF4013 domain-containing protein [Halosimplex salinum]|uniref:DUF4013 domain-containing protein n=1 Tax=Halosimplex salinum TaxID=1710538 RepID=UPI000F48A2CD|nr:DUF4013 domain-containing protein [Halosimplex salinum]
MDVDRYGAVGYPFGGESGERPVVVGWILGMLAFIVPVVPAVPFLGYLVRVVGASERGEPAPPLGDDLRGLARDSVAAVVVSLGYLVVPFLALAVTIYGAVSSNASADLEFVGALAVYGGSTAVLVLSLLGAYLLPIALAEAASDRPLRSAFARSRVVPVGKHAAYFTRWTAGAVAMSMSISVANLVAAAPRVGPVVAALVLAYGSVVACHLWGRAVGVARAR